MTTTQTIGQTDEGFDLVAAFRAAAPESRDRKFWITLAVAVTLHSLLLLSIIQSPTRQMGNPNSPPDAVAVSFVTEAELRDASTGSDGGPSAPPPVAQPAPQQPPPPQPEAQPQPETPPVPPQPQAEAVPAQPAPPPAEKAEVVEKVEEPVAPEPPPLAEATEPAAAVPKEKPEPKPPVETKAKAKAEKPVQDPKDLATDLADLLELPDPAKEARKQPAQKQQKQAMRAPDMTLPGQQKTMMQSFDGKSAGIERPAGITRSGANDDFARGVVRALRQTMPQMNALGRTTVRIIINQNGNIESVEVLARSENTDLNRAIVFSTKQASFPFPPPGATLLDRTFTITYIYH